MSRELNQLASKAAYALDHRDGTKERDYDAIGAVTKLCEALDAGDELPSDKWSKDLLAVLNRTR